MAPALPVVGNFVVWKRADYYEVNPFKSGGDITD